MTQMQTSLPGERPLVSIITCFYNRQHTVADSIGSLLAQTYRDIEIIAVDDGSTDGTGEAMEAFDDPRYRLIRQKNTGFIGALRNGIAAARGALIAIHDAGDVSYPERIEKQVRLMGERPDLGLVATSVLNDDTYGGPPREDRLRAGQDLAAGLLRGNPIHHGTVMFRRALYDKTSGYRQMFDLAEDHDLWLRMSRYAPFGLIEEVLYHRRKFEGVLSINPKKTLLQLYVGEMAMQAFEGADVHGRDIADRMGVHAFFFRRPSARLTGRLVWYGLRWLAAGRPDVAADFIQAARAESASPKVLLAGLALRLTRWPWGWRNLVAPALRRRFA